MLNAMLTAYLVKKFFKFKVQSNPFNNLPKIKKRDAINILRKPISEVRILADYYKAVFHLANFPCEDQKLYFLTLLNMTTKNLNIR